MKILFIIESLKAGGKERRLLELINGLLENKMIECIIVILNNDIHYEKAQQKKFKIYTVKNGSFPNRSKQIMDICKIFKPDIIHSWAANATLYSIFAVKKLKLKLIDSSISTAPNKVKRFSKINLINQIIFKYADLIIANSQAGLNSYNVPKNKSIFIHNGFDFNRIKNLIPRDVLRTQFSINTKYVVAMIATFYEKKDYKTYIKASLQILKKNSEITFLCIGAGDDYKYQALVSTEYKEKIKFLGRQHDVESIMNICNFTVLSTFTEGISNSILESMAMGKPVIATDGGGTSELVQDNITGFLVPAKSPEILVDKIIELIENENRRLQIGRQSRERIIKEFNIDKMVTSFIDIYNKILGS